MNSVEERTIYAKLEAMKDIRNKTLQLEKVKLKIIREVESSDAEEKCLAEYRREMELLLQEKMSHVEELRQIHADINAMESVIKQAEESRARSVSMANRLHEDYRPLKSEVDHMRREYLGLDRLPELHEEEGSIITPDRFASYYNKLQQQQQQSYASTRSSLSLPARPEATVTSGHLGGAPGGGGGGHPPSFLAPPPPPHGAMRLVGKSPGEHAPPSQRIGQPSSLTLPSQAPTFRSDFCNVNLSRQQPPPMKSCLSCHQQIHRNAPICPLCKAKSRSRNPKKPKKKDH
ncbi:zinc finger C4H2 domain-containing protein isoform X3 [Ctenocephalides felis]|uniref:zinc finger C4H2 domain-containing protein isoform X3 n=1 Tax=Ctenocephalides felis TaxID=7515 RepID=UPI000E6E1140|nr:zinc finger C4H2 domain-containing protein isoform X3 [Ctenocephalides felis]